jgi:membrane protein implicated in regulation of membrane protease activity
MSPRALLAAACLVAGVLLAAWSLAAGHLLLAIAGFALIFVFLYLVMEAMSKAGKPKDGIKPAANAAWSMKDQPAGSDQSGEPR